MAEMLDVKELTIGYGKNELISNINFSIEAGEICVLIGPNGAGKSTLLKTLAGTIPAISGSASVKDLGEIVVSGKNHSHKNRFHVSESARAKCIASLFTSNLEPDYSTCFDVVAMGRFPYTGSFGMLSENDKTIIFDSLRMVGGEELAELEFKHLSDGQKQRVLMARLFAQEPKLILLDEPTTFLDIRYKLEIMQSLKEYVKKTGAAVLMSLHELDLAKDVSDSVVAVDADSCHKLEPEEAFDEAYIRELFHIKSDI